MSMYRQIPVQEGPVKKSAPASTSLLFSSRFCFGLSFGLSAPRHDFRSSLPAPVASSFVFFSENKQGTDKRGTDRTTRGTEKKKKKRTWRRSMKKTSKKDVEKGREAYNHAASKLYDRLPKRQRDGGDVLGGSVASIRNQW